MIITETAHFEIENLIDKYSEKHPLAKQCGAEYIFQSNSAQVDALTLVAEIFEIIRQEYRNSPHKCSECFSYKNGMCDYYGATIDDPNEPYFCTEFDPIG